jgi:hypothetical protein
MAYCQLYRLHHLHDRMTDCKMILLQGDSIHCQKVVKDKTSNSLNKEILKPGFTVRIWLVFEDLTIFYGIGC